MALSLKQFAVQNNFMRSFQRFWLGLVLSFVLSVIAVGSASTGSGVGGVIGSGAGVAATSGVGASKFFDLGRFSMYFFFLLA